MQFRFPLAQLAFGLLGSLAAACGGSSSETPPPERPDSRQLELRKPKATESGAQAGQHHSIARFGKQGRAESTWGQGNHAKPKPAAEPDAGVIPE